MRTFNQTAHGVEPVLKLDHTRNGPFAIGGALREEPKLAAK